MNTNNDTNTAEESASYPADCSPLFVHDCELCHFLGVFNGHDLYYCDKANPIPTVIARFGDDGPDYKSGLCFADVDKEIREGKRRAEMLGFLEENKGIH